MIAQVQPLVLVLTSAAVAALVTGGIALAGQMLERRSRRRELLLAKAVDLAQQRFVVMREQVQKGGGGVSLMDSIYMTEFYYRWLRHLMDHSELPKDAKQLLENTIRDLREKGIPYRL